MAISARYDCVKTVRLEDGQVENFVLCDNNGAFFLRLTNDCGITTAEAFELDGVTPYVPVGPVTECSTTSRDIEQRLFCDDNSGTITPYLVAYEYDDTGAIVGTTITLIDGTTPYVPTGITRVCAGEDGDVEVVLLCDDNGEFLRQLVFDNAGVIVGAADTLLDGTTGYVVVGSVVDCSRVTSLSALNLIPNLLGSDQVIDVTTTQNTFAGFGGTLHADTTHVQIRYEYASTRMTVDGNIPIAGHGAGVLGTLYLPNDMRMWPIEAINSARFVANSGVTAYLQISEFKGV